MHELFTIISLFGKPFWISQDIFYISNGFEGYIECLRTFGYYDVAEIISDDMLHRTTRCDTLIIFDDDHKKLRYKWKEDPGGYVLDSDYYSNNARTN